MAQTQFIYHVTGPQSDLSLLKNKRQFTSYCSRSNGITSRNVDLNTLSCAVNKIHFQLPANAAALLLIDAVSYTSALKHLSAVIFEDFPVPAHSESLLFETINYQIVS